MPKPSESFFPKQLALAEQERRQREQIAAESRDRAELATRWDRVNFAWNQETHTLPKFLAEWVSRIAELHQDLDRRGLLTRLAEPPDNFDGDELQAWHDAIKILRTASVDSDKAVLMLAEIKRWTLDEGRKYYANAVVHWLWTRLKDQFYGTLAVNGVAEVAIPRSSDCENPPASDSPSIVDQAHYDPSEQKPVKWLHGWGEILGAIGETNTKEKQGMFKRLTLDRQGPIIIGKKGERPYADKVALLKWYDHLHVEHESRQHAAEGARAEAADQHAYGKSATVVPGINGSVKERRGSRR